MEYHRHEFANALLNCVILSHGFDSQLPHLTNGNSEITAVALGPVARIQWAMNMAVPNSSSPSFSKSCLGVD